MLGNYNDNNNDKNNINNNLLVITSINNNKINELKRKIDTITKYQKPYISKMLNNLLLENPINAEIICNYIVAEQNEINIKESTKETKIKSLTLELNFHLKNDIDPSFHFR